MNGISQLRIAWWNTSLYQSQAKTTPSPDKWQIAEAVVRQLVDDDGIDLLVLGEVQPMDVERLRKCCSDEVPLQFVLDDASSEGKPLDIGFVFNHEKLELIASKINRDMYLGKTLSREFYACFKTRLSEELIHVFAVHWPSRSFTSGADERSSLGFAAQQRIRNLAPRGEIPFVIVIGDFNDEPFDASVTRCLQGSRDRTLVRKNPDSLYNPFWRWLGEQQSLQAETPLRLPAGTYYYRGTPSTHWYTFDQILVSPAFLRETGWVLWEDEITVWRLPPLINERARLSTDFDHLPIVGTFRWVPGIEAHKSQTGVTV